MPSLIPRLCLFDTTITTCAELTKFSRSRSVSFDPNVRVCDHIQVADLTLQERERTWYSRHDLYIIRLDAHRTLLRMEDSKNGNPEATLYDCTRGLESKTQAGCKLRHRHREEATKIILDVQEEQRWLADQTPNSEPIARAYANATKDCIEIAHHVALLDHQSVMDESGPSGKRKDCCLLEREPLLPYNNPNPRRKKKVRLLLISNMRRAEGAFSK